MESLNQMPTRSFFNIRRLLPNWYGSLAPSFCRVLLLTSFIFFLDAITMYFLRYSGVTESYLLSLFLESSVLILSLLPVLYLLVLRPLVKQIRVSILSEKASKESLELLSGVFSSINEAVFIVLTETRVLTNLNSSAERM